MGANAQAGGGKGYGQNQMAYAGGSPTFREMGPISGDQNSTGTPGMQDAANAGQLSQWDSGGNSDPSMTGGGGGGWATADQGFNEAGGGPMSGKGAPAQQQWGSQGGKGTGGMGGKGQSAPGMMQGQGSSLASAMSQRMHPQTAAPVSSDPAAPGSAPQGNGGAASWTPTGSSEEQAMMAGLSNGGLQDNNSYWQNQLLNSVGGDQTRMNNVINNNATDWGRAAFALHAGTDPAAVAQQFGYTPDQISRLQTMMQGHYGG